MFAERKFFRESQGIGNQRGIASNGPQTHKGQAFPGFTVIAVIVFKLIQGRNQGPLFASGAQIKIQTENKTLSRALLQNFLKFSQST
ncbi:hypothetical protein D3C87_1131560 [compost metagenome]